MTAASKTFLSNAAPAPRLGEKVVANAVAEKFGLVGEYAALVSERDQNFRVKTADGTRFVAKVTNATEDRGATDFQIAALVHLEACGIMGVPRIIRTTSGGNRSTIHADDGSELCLRVVSWIDGHLLNDTDVTPEIAGRFGRRLAEMDMALESFEYEGDGDVPLWDLQRAGQLRGLLIHVSDRNIRDQVEAVLDNFDKRVTPALKALPTQVIHNDANTENILLDASGDVSGIIDFGDALRAPRIIEVSIAAAYLRAVGEDRLRIIAPFVAGYDHRSPLLDTELDLLFDLVRTRLSMTLVILYWRLSARDEDDPYRKKTLEGESDAFEFLKFLTELGGDRFLQRLARET
jgi:hydroxylysine kinase